MLGLTRQHVAPLRRDAGAARATSSRTRRRASTGSARACSTSASRRSTRWSCGRSRADHLQQLSDETGHTVNMAILDGTDIVYIERCRSSAAGPARDRPQPARRLAAAGVLHVDGQGAARRPAGGGAAGVLDEVQFQQRGPNTLIERKALEPRRSSSVREAGIAVNNEELAYGLRSIAVPGARPLRRRSPRRSTSPSTARWSRWTTSSIRPQPGADAHRGRDLGADRLPAVRRLGWPAPRRDRRRLRQRRRRDRAAARRRRARRLRDRGGRPRREPGDPRSGAALGALGQPRGLGVHDRPAGRAATAGSSTSRAARCSAARAA